MSRPSPWQWPGLEGQDSHLETSLTFLRNRFVETGDPAVALAIAHHLRVALLQPTIRNNPGLRAFYNSQLRLWLSLSEPAIGVARSSPQQDPL